MFKLNENANINGTSLKGYVITRFEWMVERFGPPLDGDGYKSSGEWYFSDDKGNAFTVYDWKMTDLYDSGLMSVKEFRQLDEYKFHIGGNADATDFIDWLKGEI